MPSDAEARTSVHGCKAMKVLVVDADTGGAESVAGEITEQIDGAEAEAVSGFEQSREQLRTTGSLDCLVCVTRPDDGIDTLALQSVLGETHPGCASVFVGGQTDLGVTALEHGVTDFVPRDDEGRWLSVLPDRIEAATERATGFHDDTEATLEALNEVTRELIAADTTHEVAVVTNEYANDVLGFPATSVRRYNPENHALEVIQIGAQVGEETDRPPYPVDDSPHGKAFRRGEPVIDDLRGVEDDAFDREVFTQCMYVPIGEYGTISIGLTEGTLSTLDIKFAEILANNARVAFDEATQKEQLSTTLTEIDAFATQVVETSEAVHSAVTDVAEANEHVVDAADDISAGADEQSALLQDATEETETLLDVVGQIAALADDVADQSQESRDLAEKGNRRAQTAVDSMEDIRAQVDTLVGEIESLRGEIEDVVEIVDVIDGIAQETNMLALNASIEAARADASGDGFAVVADEVKQLAAETKESTDEIRDVVDRVTAQSETVGSTMQQMQSDIAAGTSTVEETVETLAAIQQSVEETDTGVQQISQRVDQQASAVRDVDDIVDRVATISQETATKTDTVATIATDQAEPIDDVTDRADQLGTVARELRTLAADLSSDRDTAINSEPTQSPGPQST
jgi:methyl-accepting chemotaxis protein